MSKSRKFKITILIIGLLLIMTITSCLIWRNLRNTYDMIGQKDMLTHFPEHPKEEEIVSLIEQTKLYRDEVKVINSLSSGKRGLKIIVSLSDTTKNIYLVRVLEDNGNNLVTYFNFLVGANEMKIINPTGKLEGQ